ncbi:helix-turn-helix domain-containing protein [Chryseobacterium sp. ISL-6]|uniref:helix-turn-helix domain-containing protein n=1 Tax=Chryseobacterium sp. ISL-6 TaxID=2819143 RepID=UPI001BE5EE1E|nr:helix-turn-helix domain-containing protein [Chryseobacterium sp. ISL-6]MBT2620405.1 AraC family transcriptional regulator [Chryseobacterium sp. ISL-6]
MELKLMRPKDKTLAKYMEGYYFLNKDRSSKDIEYLTFPNNYSILSVSQNIELKFGENEIKAIGINNGRFSSDLICHYKKPIKVSIQGHFNEITFYFKPLGLNAFLIKPLKEYTKDFSQVFLPYDDYKESMISILNEKNNEKQIDMIEEFWMSKYVGFNHSFFTDLVDDVMKDLDKSLESHATQYKTSRQTINKLFDIHLGKSPSDFRKIQRFRETLIQSVDKKTLTELSYDHLFYDQSHLIKDFKSLTGLTPKNFFAKVYSEGKVKWLFL